MVRMKIQVSSSTLLTLVFYLCLEAGERERERVKWEKVVGKNEKKIVLFHIFSSLFFSPSPDNGRRFFILFIFSSFFSLSSGLRLLFSDRMV